MAKKRGAGATDIDWYLISIDRLKQIGLVVFLLLLAGAGYWYMRASRGNPRTNAQSAIATARQALNALAESKEFAQRRSEFDRARKRLDEATSLFSKASYPQSLEAAVESQTISRTALAGTGTADYDAQFLTVEGDVSFQRSGGDWKKADPRTTLSNGDWVKTGDRASAELMFQNTGALYTVGPNALLEIYAQMTASNKKMHAVQMQVGSVEVLTSNESSTVRTPGSQVVVETDSTTQVGVEGGTKSTSVVSTKGSTQVVSNTGGEPVKLAVGDKISATATGSLSGITKLTLPPALVTPPDSQVFQVSPDSKAEFTWNVQPGATAYQLQVSRSRLFSTLEINSRRSKPSATAKVTAEGTFYWRVASIGADGEVGPFSPFRRFRVSGGGTASAGGPSPTTDKTPPALTLKAPFNIGGQFFMIEGTTEPGSTVFINDEEVDVESNGHFKKLVSFNKLGANSVVVKAVDPAGNPTIQTQTVLVEE